MQNVEKKKNDVQELQRDLTLRRCLSKGTVFSDMIISIEKLEHNLKGHHSILEQKHPILEKVILFHNFTVIEIYILDWQRCSPMHMRESMG